MKNILIYINDSLGELDWIAPFIKSEEGKEFNFYIYLNGPGKTYQEKIDILRKYGLLSENIFSINSNSKKDFYLFTLDDFLNRVLGRIKLFSYALFLFMRKLFDLFRIFVATILSGNKTTFNYIFRDYNLKNSFSLIHYIRMNENAKIIVFPHAVGLQRSHPSCPREPLKEVKADLWFENSDLSNIVKKSKIYKDIFIVTGVPAFDNNYKKKTLFSTNVKRVLIITRDCGMTFGFTYVDAFSIFDTLLQKLNQLGYEIKIKHHPRDRKLNEWRDIQSRYSKIEELEGSLNDIKDTYSACYTLFSTAPLFLLSRGVPVFEFSPYKNIEEYKEQLPMHYVDDENLLTHDLLNLELYKRLNKISKIEKYMSNEYLTKLAKKQYLKCQEIFPMGANKKIMNILKEKNI